MITGPDGDAFLILDQDGPLAIPLQLWQSGQVRSAEGFAFKLMMPMTNAISARLRPRSMPFLSLTICCFCFCGVLLTSPLALAVERTIGPSGEPVPRFLSLKADEVNVRQGPGRDHKIKWVFKKLGLPVKVVSEYEDWREIEDHAGAKGWIYYGLLSRRRTAITLDPKEKGLNYISLRERNAKGAKAIAQLGKGVIVHILECNGSWCHIAVNKGLKGWLAQNLIWGLFEKEPVRAE